MKTKPKKPPESSRRFAELEARVAAAEARIAQLEARPAYQGGWNFADSLTYRSVPTPGVWVQQRGVGDWIGGTTT